MVSPERTLVEQIKARDKNAFNSLIDEYYVRLMEFLWRLLHNEEDARDIVQEIFTKIWENPEKWNPKESLESYLFRSARNAALNHLRSKKYHEDIHDLADALKSNDDIPADKLEKKELKRCLGKAIDSLSEELRIPFILSRFLDFSYKRIAGTLVISEKSVEKRMGKVLKFLREKCKKYYEEVD